MQNLRNKHVLFLASIIAASIAVRLILVLIIGNEMGSLPGTTDQISYHTLAQRVLTGHGFSFGEPWWPATRAGAPTAHWSFLYTFYLTGIYALFGPNPIVARIIQVLLVGFLQPYLLYLLGKRIFHPAAGLAAAGLGAGYIYLNYYSATLMTEPFYITALLAVLLVALKIAAPKEDETQTKPQSLQLAALLGILLGITVLLRQAFLLFIPFLFLWMLWARRKQAGKMLASLVISGGIVAAMILPFTYYNYVRFNHFVLLNTNAGFVFFWANHPVYGTTFEGILSSDKPNYLQLLPVELKDLNEAQLDSELMRRGMQFVFDDPGRYILLSLSRIPVYFNFWPSADSSLLSNLSRLFSFGLLLPFMVYGIILSIIGQKRKGFNLASPTVLLLLFGLVYSGIHLLTWSLVRYRLPVDAVFLVFAGLAIQNLAERIFSRKNQSTETETLVSRRSSI